MLMFDVSRYKTATVSLIEGQWGDRVSNHMNQMTG